ncbi:hypothetical protein AAE026_04805 [Bradyrhizobium sp. DN5]|uniref:hypothetical protein n=1 Tax=Bradyrhizobium sp. DN5 TaxID=3056950 RepID=UPI0035255066
MNHTNVVAGRANQHRSVARMERSVIRDRCVRTDGIPDCAALHPGYKTLRCPSGKTRKPWVNARHPKYSPLPKFGNGVCVAATRPKEEGRIAIVTNAGRAAVDVDHTGAKGFAGRATVSESVTPTTVRFAYGQIVWSWRPGSVRQVWR